MSPSILYFWKKAEETNFVSTVCQQLGEESSLDTARRDDANLVSPCPSAKKKRKNADKRIEDEKREGEERLEKIMVEGNQVLKESNEEIKISNKHKADANKEKELFRKQQMAINLSLRIKECQEKIEMCEDKLDEENEGSAKFRRFLKRKNDATDEMKDFQKKLEQYE